MSFNANQTIDTDFFHEKQGVLLSVNGSSSATIESEFGIRIRW